MEQNKMAGRVIVIVKIQTIFCD